MTVRRIAVRQTAVRRAAVRPRARTTRIDEPTLFQFVVLSMLLHILAVVLFGATGRGGTGRGEELPGALDVTLQRPAARGNGFQLAPSATEPPSSGATVRPPLESGEKHPTRPETRTETPATRAVPEITPLEIEKPSVPESMPEFNPTAPEEIDRALRLAPSMPSGAPAIETTPEPLAPIVPPSTEHELAQPIEPARIVPVAPVERLERVAPPPTERALLKPVELPQEAIPNAPVNPLERIAPPRIEREMAPPVEPLKEQVIAPAAPMENSVPPTIEREMTPPMELPARAVPAAPVTPIERVVPPTIERELAPAVEAPVRVPTRSPSAESEAKQPAPPSPANVPAESPTSPSAGPQSTPSPSETAPASRFGAPQPDEDIFKPRQDSPGETRHLDLEAAKKRAVREMAGEGSGSTGVLPFPLPVPEKKTKEAKAMEKAIKPDCRTAYAGLGLLAVPVLVASAITDEGCHW